MAYFLFFILVQFSLFALGTVVVTTGVLATKRPPYWWSYVGAMWCIGIIVGILLVLVIQGAGGKVDPRPVTYLYLAAVGGLTPFFIFICRDLIRRSFESHLEGDQ